MVEISGGIEDTDSGNGTLTIELDSKVTIYGRASGLIGSPARYRALRLSCCRIASLYASTLKPNRLSLGAGLAEINH
jgi:hypothetical protein